MDPHIAKETELNAYSQVDRLDDAPLTFAFGQLSRAQEQIRAATREFIRECAAEIRTETDGRNARLVEKIIDKHNRLIEVMLLKSSFLQNVISEISVAMSSGGGVTKEQVKSITDGLKTTIAEILKGREGKSGSKAESASKGNKVDPLALLKDQTVVQQIAKCFKTRIHGDYRKMLTKDRQIAKRFNIRNSLTGMRNLAKSVTDMNSKLNSQFKKQQTIFRKTRATTLPRKSSVSTKGVKTAQIGMLKLYNDYVSDRTLKVIDRTDRIYAGALWYKLKTNIRISIKNFKSGVARGVKSLFSTKMLIGGIGIVGKVMTTVLIKPFVAVGRLLKVSLKGVYDFGVGIVKGAGKLVGTIFGFLNTSMLKKIFKFVFSPAGMFVAGYIFAFLRSKIKLIYGGIRDRVTNFICKMTKVVGKVKTFVAKGLLALVDGIATNKILIAFLTKDSATIAQFVDNIKIQFSQKFDVIRDFFHDLVSNFTANVASNALSWIGSIIGTALGGPLGSIIGSLAGAGLAMLLGKLFADKIFKLPSSDVDARERVKPLRKKYGRVTKNDAYKGQGFVAQIQGEINRLKREQEENIRKYKDGETSGFDNSGLIARQRELEKLQVVVMDISDTQSYDGFYKKVGQVIDRLFKNEESENWQFGLPGSSEDLLAILTSDDPFKPELWHASRDIDDGTGNTTRINEGYQYSQIYRQIKLQILNKLFFASGRATIKPEKFCEMYECSLNDELNKDYTEKLTAIIRAANGFWGKYDQNFMLTEHNTLRDYLTRPIVSEDGEGVFKPSKDGVRFSSKPGEHKQYIKTFGEDILKNSMDKDVGFVKVGGDDQNQTNGLINKIIYNIINGDGPNSLNSILNDICGGDQEKVKLLKESFPLETWYETYIRQNFFDYFYIGSAGTPVKMQGVDPSDLPGGFRKFLKRIISLPDPARFARVPEEKRRGLLDMLNKLRQGLDGAVDVQDQGFQEGLTQMKEKEAEMKREIENDPELVELQKRCDELKRQYAEICKIEAEKRKELTDKAKGVTPVVVGPTREAATKQKSLSEQEKPKAKDPMKLDAADFGFSQSMPSLF